MNFYGSTNIGKKREKNEDCFGIFKISDNATLLAVCDGMGGEAGGAVASSIALRSFAEEVRLQAQDYLKNGNLCFSDCENDVPMLLDGAVGSANYDVWQRAQDDVSLKGMGTTLVAIFIMTDPIRAWTVNVGDSRLYRISKVGIEQMTKDHSYIQYLLDTGAITSAEADLRTDRNIITRAVGISVQLQTDINEISVSDGEYILLCSDGLHGMLTSNEIYEIVSSKGESPAAKVDKLISAANSAGGDDNITVILAEI